MITIYTTPTCKYSDKVRRLLEDAGKDYKICNVLMDPAARDHLIDKTGEVFAPTIEVDGQFLVGFIKSDVQRMLNV